MDQTSIAFVYALELSMISGARYHRVATYSAHHHHHHHHHHRHHHQCCGLNQCCDVSIVISSLDSEKRQADRVENKCVLYSAGRTGEEAGVVVVGVCNARKAKVADLQITRGIQQ